MIRRPPRSTLFPYTTLFRSGLLGQRPVRVDGDPHLAATADVPGHRDPGRLDLAVGHVGVLQCLDADRKSTRLNSSHSQISYAVFCLKKKNHYHMRSAFDNSM